MAGYPDGTGRAAGDPAAGADGGAGREVIVVGAGPVGLFTATELARRGIDTLVLERRAPGPRESRAQALHVRSSEILDLCGLIGEFSRDALRMPAFPMGATRRARIGFARLDTRYPHILVVPQQEQERMLLERARALGAEVRWEHEVVGVAQDADAVALTVRTADGAERTERAAYVVGCDGARSAVRTLSGIPFPGAANPGAVVLADVFLDLPRGATTTHITAGGLVAVFPYADGSFRVVLYDNRHFDAAAEAPVTLEEVSVGLRRIIGTDLGVRDPYWLTRYRSEQRQAGHYRDRRVLLAGDAAHVHAPTGALGLNTGLADAVNLGWKLAATVRGQAPPWLLDTYEAERHPAGAAVLAAAREHLKLNRARTRRQRLVRRVRLGLLLPLPPVQRRFALRMSGLGTAYGAVAPAPEPHGRARAPHPWTGRRVPDADLAPAAGAETGSAVPTRLYALARGGRFVLLERLGERRRTGAAATAPDIRATAAGWAETVCAVAARVTGRRGWPAAVLMRPDGYAAWATDEADPLARHREAAAALAHWCGAPAPGVPERRRAAADAASDGG